jgi:hypothetical protein
VLGVVKEVPKAATSPSSLRGVGVVGSPSSSRDFRSDDDQPVRMSDKLVGATSGPFSNVPKDDDAIATDQLWLYEHERHSQMSIKDSLIGY